MAQCKLTERIEIQYFNNNMQDDEGFTSESWETYYKCWSNFRSISGKEYTAAKATQSENIVTFTIRYCKKARELLKKDSTKKFRIFFNGQFYDIEYVSDFRNEHNFIDIKCNIS